MEENEQEQQLTLEQAYDRIAKAYGIPQTIWQSLLTQESGGNVNARGPETGRGRAGGAFQIMPDTFTSLGYNPATDYNDPIKVAEAGMRHLRDSYRKFANQAPDAAQAWKMAIAAYHAGDGAVERDLKRGGTGVPGTVDKAAGITTPQYVNRIFSRVDVNALDRAPDGRFLPGGSSGTQGTVNVSIGEPSGKVYRPPQPQTPQIQQPSQPRMVGENRSVTMSDLPSLPEYDLPTYTPPGPPQPVPYVEQDLPSININLGDAAQGGVQPGVGTQPPQGGGTTQEKGQQEQPPTTAVQPPGQRGTTSKFQPSFTDSNGNKFVLAPDQTNLRGGQARYTLESGPAKRDTISGVSDTEIDSNNWIYKNKRLTLEQSIYNKSDVQQFEQQEINAKLQNFRPFYVGKEGLTIDLTTPGGMQNFRAWSQGAPWLSQLAQRQGTTVRLTWNEQAALELTRQGIPTLPDQVLNETNKLFKWKNGRVDFDASNVGTFLGGRQKSRQPLISKAVGELQRGQDISPATRQALRNSGLTEQQITQDPRIQSTAAVTAPARDFNRTVGVFTGEILKANAKENAKTLQVGARAQKPQRLTGTNINPNEFLKLPNKYRDAAMEIIAQQASGLISETEARKLLQKIQEEGRPLYEEAAANTSPTRIHSPTFAGQPIETIATLGGRDTYTPEQDARIQDTLDRTMVPDPSETREMFYAGLSNNYKVDERLGSTTLGTIENWLLSTGFGAQLVGSSGRAKDFFLGIFQDFLPTSTVQDLRQKSANQKAFAEGADQDRSRSKIGGLAGGLTGDIPRYVLLGWLLSRGGKGAGAAGAEVGAAGTSLVRTGLQRLAPGLSRSAAGGALPPLVQSAALFSLDRYLQSRGRGDSPQQQDKQALIGAGEGTIFFGAGWLANKAITRVGEAVLRKTAFTPDVIYKWVKNHPNSRWLQQAFREAVEEGRGVAGRTAKQIGGRGPGVTTSVQEDVINGWINRIARASGKSYDETVDVIKRQILSAKYAPLGARARFKIATELAGGVTRVGVITTGITGIGIAEGLSPQKAFDHAVQLAMVDLVLHYGPGLAEKAGKTAVDRAKAFKEWAKTNAGRWFSFKRRTPDGGEQGGFYTTDPNGNVHRAEYVDPSFVEAEIIIPPDPPKQLPAAPNARKTTPTAEAIKTAQTDPLVNQVAPYISADQPLSVPELQKLTKLSYKKLDSALQKMFDAGLIEITPDGKVVGISEAPKADLYNRFQQGEGETSTETPPTEELAPTGEGDTTTQQGQVNTPEPGWRSNPDSEPSLQNNPNLTQDEEIQRISLVLFGNKGMTAPAIARAAQVPIKEMQRHLDNLWVAGLIEFGPNGKVRWASGQLPLHTAEARLNRPGPPTRTGVQPPQPPVVQPPTGGEQPPPGEAVTPPTASKPTQITGPRPKGMDETGQPEIPSSDGYSLVNINGKTIFRFRERPIVLVNIDGVNIPFYTSTGTGGKKETTTGQWYPFFGFAPRNAENPGWINKTQGADMADFYGSAKLRKAAEWLNQNFPDILKDRNMSAATAKDVDVINRGRKTVDKDDFEGVATNINDALSQLGEKPYFIKTPKGLYLTRRELIKIIKDVEEEIATLKKELNTASSPNERTRLERDLAKATERYNKGQALLKGAYDKVTTPTTTEPPIIKGGEAGTGKGATGTTPTVVKPQPTSTDVTLAGEDLLDTRGKGVFFHGSAQPILKFDEGYYNHMNIYGQGLYTTDSATRGWDYTAKNRKSIAKSGGTPRRTLYKIEETVPVKFFDLDTPFSQLDPDLRNDIQSNLETNGSISALDGVYELDRNPNISLAKIMDEIRNASASARESTDTIQEVFAGIQELLEKRGFGGYEHEGGKLMGRGKHPHKVKIYWNPIKQTKLIRVTPADVNLIASGGKKLPVDFFAPIRAEAEKALQTASSAPDSDIVTKVGAVIISKTPLELKRALDDLNQLIPQLSNKGQYNLTDKQVNSIAIFAKAAGKLLGDLKGKTGQVTKTAPKEQQAELPLTTEAQKPSGKSEAVTKTPSPKQPVKKSEIAKVSEPGGKTPIKLPNIQALETTDSGTGVAVKFKPHSKPPRRRRITSEFDDTPLGMWEEAYETYRESIDEVNDQKKRLAEHQKGDFKVDQTIYKKGTPEWNKAIDRETQIIREAEKRLIKQGEALNKRKVRMEESGLMFMPEKGKAAETPTAVKPEAKDKAEQAKRRRAQAKQEAAKEEEDLYAPVPAPTKNRKLTPEVGDKVTNGRKEGTVVERVDPKTKQKSIKVEYFLGDGTPIYKPLDSDWQVVEKGTAEAKGPTSKEAKKAEKEAKQEEKKRQKKERDAEKQAERDRKLAEKERKKEEKKQQKAEKAEAKRQEAEEAMLDEAAKDLEKFFEDRAKETEEANKKKFEELEKGDEEYQKRIEKERQEIERENREQNKILTEKAERRRLERDADYVYNAWLYTMEMVYKPTEKAELARHYYQAQHSANPVFRRASEKFQQKYAEDGTWKMTTKTVPADETGGSVRILTKDQLVQIGRYRDRNVPDANIADIMNVPVEIIAAVPRTPVVGDFGMVPHHLMAADKSGNISLFNELEDIFLPDRNYGEIVEDSTRRKLLLDVIAQKYGARRMSEMTLEQWKKMLQENHQSLSHENLLIIVDALEAQSEWSEAIQKFAAREDVQQILKDIADMGLDLMNFDRTLVISKKDLANRLGEAALPWRDQKETQKAYDLLTRLQNIGLEYERPSTFAPGKFEKTFSRSAILRAAKMAISRTLPSRFKRPDIGDTAPGEIFGTGWEDPGSYLEIPKTLLSRDGKGISVARLLNRVQIDRAKFAALDAKANALVHKYDAAAVDAWRNEVADIFEQMGYSRDVAMDLTANHLLGTMFSQGLFRQYAWARKSKDKVAAERARNELLRRYIDFGLAPADAAAAFLEMRMQEQEIAEKRNDLDAAFTKDPAGFLNDFTFIQKGRTFILDPRGFSVVIRALDLEDIDNGNSPDNSGTLALYHPPVSVTGRKARTPEFLAEIAKQMWLLNKPVVGDQIMKFAVAVADADNTYGEFILGHIDPEFDLVTKFSLQEEELHAKDFAARGYEPLSELTKLQDFMNSRSNAFTKAGLRLMFGHYRGAPPEVIAAEVIAKSLREDSQRVLKLTKPEVTEIFHTYAKYLVSKGGNPKDVMNQFTGQHPDLDAMVKDWNDFVAANPTGAMVAQPYINKGKGKTNAKSNRQPNIVKNVVGGKETFRFSDASLSAIRGGRAEKGGVPVGEKPIPLLREVSRPPKGTEEKIISKASEPNRAMERVERNGVQYLRTPNNPEYRLTKEEIDSLDSMPLSLLAAAEDFIYAAKFADDVPKGTETPYFRSRIGRFSFGRRGPSGRPEKLVPYKKPNLAEKALQPENFSALFSGMSWGVAATWELSGLAKSTLSSGDISYLGRQAWLLLTTLPSSQRRLTPAAQYRLSQGMTIFEDFGANESHWIAPGMIEDVYTGAWTFRLNKKGFNTANLIKRLGLAKDAFTTVPSIYKVPAAWRAFFDKSNESFIKAGMAPRSVYKGFTTWLNSSAWMDLRKQTQDLPDFDLLVEYGAEVGDLRKPKPGDIVHNTFVYGKTFERKLTIPKQRLSANGKYIDEAGRVTVVGPLSVKVEGPIVKGDMVTPKPRRERNLTTNEVTIDFSDRRKGIVFEDTDGTLKVLYRTDGRAPGYGDIALNKLGNIAPANPRTRIDSSVDRWSKEHYADESWMPYQTGTDRYSGTSGREAYPSALAGLAPMFGKVEVTRPGEQQMRELWNKIAPPLEMTRKILFTLQRRSARQFETVLINMRMQAMQDLLNEMRVTAALEGRQVSITEAQGMVRALETIFNLQSGQYSQALSRDLAPLVGTTPTAKSIDPVVQAIARTLGGRLSPAQLMEVRRTLLKLRGRSVTSAEIKAVVDTINLATKYVNLPKDIVKYGNLALFSTRLSAASIRQIADVGLASRLPSTIRGKVYGGYLRAIGAFAAILLALGYYADARIIYDDPTDPGFLKVRIGDQSYDFSGGLLQFITLFARTGDILYDEFFMSNKEKLIKQATGEARDKNNWDALMGLWGRFARKKFGPAVSFIMNGMSKKTVMGEPTTWGKEWARMWTPITWSQMNEVYEHDGYRGLIGTLAESGGFGTTHLPGAEFFAGKILEAQRDPELIRNPEFQAQVINQLVNMMEYATREETKRRQEDFQKQQKPGFFQWLKRRGGEVSDYFKQWDEIGHDPLDTSTMAPGELDERIKGTLEQAAKARQDAKKVREEDQDNENNP
jgi:ketosteroid isomerase-like protein